MGLSLSTISSSITTALYVGMTAVSGNGLISKMPKLLSGDLAPSGQVADVVVNAILFSVATVQLAKIAGVLGKVDYESLENLPASYAREAGERALAGEVAALSKDGRYAVATFAGGCFWGTELHYQV